MERKVNWRIVILYFSMVLFFTLVISKIIIIQHTEDFGQHQPFFKLVEAPRGNIFSSDGNLLAISMPLYDVGVDFTVIEYQLFEQEILALSKKMAHLYGDKTPQEYESFFRRNYKIAQNENKRYFLLKKNVNFNEVKQLKSFPIFNKGQWKGGLVCSRKENRITPFASLASRTIGYKREGVPVGIEGAYNQVLQGEDGKKMMQEIRVKVGKNTFKTIGMEINTGINVLPKPGDDVISTIHTDYQDVTEAALRRALEKHQADFGCVALMDVQTGEIKAISNLTKNKDGDYEELYNYMIGNHIEPGSTFKLASLLAGLEDGLFSLSDSVDTENGTHKFYDKTMFDSKKGGHGKITLGESFVVSSNVGISKVVYNAYAKDPKRFVDRLYKLQLSTPLDIEIPTPEHPKIKSPDDADWYGTTLPWMSIGYEISLTPIHILTFYNAVANHGKMVKPYFVKGVSRNGIMIQENKPEIINPAICAKSNIDKVIPLMIDVVERGTARNIWTNRYKIAGKTGTALLNYGARKEGDGKNYQSSFVGFFPADKPKYSCIVVVNNPTQNGFYGGDVAAPVFKEIADKVFAFDLNLKHDISSKPKNEMPKLKNGKQEDLQLVLSELDIQFESEDAEWVINASNNNLLLRKKEIEQELQNGIVPNLQGMGIQDVLYLLENSGLSVQFSGRGSVVKQSLQAGVKFNKGNRIKIELA